MSSRKLKESMHRQMEANGEGMISVGEREREREREKEREKFY